MNHLTTEEEKKEGTNEIGFEGKAIMRDDKEEEDGKAIMRDDKEEEDDDDELEGEELGDLPPEIAENIGKDRCFASEEELQSALVDAGAGDLPVVLIEGKPRLIMPSDQHNHFTSLYNKHFEVVFSKNRWGFSSGTHKIFLSNGKSLDPDLSFWGYPRCHRNQDGVLQPEAGSIPDAIIQFSWQNKAQYEEDAIDDMMSRALQKDHGSLSATRPTVGYLIKVLFSRKRTLQGAIKGSKTQDVRGIDIYRLTHGTTVADARDPNNSNSQHWRYVPGGQEVLIAITPAELGITGVWSWLCGEYKIKASAIFKEMQLYHQQRQANGLAT